MASKPPVEAKETKQKGLTDDQLRAAMEKWAEIQELLASPQVKDPQTLVQALGQLETVSTAQIALAVLVLLSGKGGR